MQKMVFFHFKLERKQWEKTTKNNNTKKHTKNNNNNKKTQQQRTNKKTATVGVLLFSR